MNTNTIAEKNIKTIIHHRLPVSLTRPLPLQESGQIYITIALQRSGQHAVINWLCEQLGSVVHFNHCTFMRKGMTMMPVPVSGRYVTYSQHDKTDSGIIASERDKTALEAFFNQLADIDLYQNVIYSFEDWDLQNIYLQKLIRNHRLKIILILRDPYNWLASSFKHHDDKAPISMLKEKKKRLISYLEQVLNVKDYLKHDVVAIDFSQWLASIQYRKEIMEHLGLTFSKSLEVSSQEVQPFGGGSSFDGQTVDSQILRKSVSERWRSYEENQEYRALLKDDNLENLALQFFKISKPF